MKLCYVFSKDINITQYCIYISNGIEAITANEKLKESILFSNINRIIYFYIFDINDNIKLHNKYKKIKVLNIYPLGISLADLHDILNRINFRKISKKDRIFKCNDILSYDNTFKKIGDFLNEMMFVDVKKFDYNKYAIYISNLY